MSDEYIESFSKEVVSRTTSSSPALQNIQGIFPHGVLHSDESMSYCARVLFQGPTTERQNECDSSGEMVYFPPMEDLSLQVARSEEHLGSTLRINLHCNSVVSSSQCSSDPDILSVRLDPIAEREEQGVGNQLSKSDAHLLDSVDVGFEKYYDIDLLRENWSRMRDHILGVLAEDAVLSSENSKLSGNDCLVDRS